MSLPFKFNFAADGAASEDVHTDDKKSQFERRIGKEIFPSQSTLEMTETYYKESKFHPFKCLPEDESDKSLRYISVSKQSSHGSEEHNSLLQKLSSRSTDLIPGEYEGGFKIWECSVDLIKFLRTIKHVFVSGVKVLELGCGAGIPGIYCLSQGAIVHFQDYNEEVISMTTVPNVIINSKFDNKINPGSCRYFSGDWSSVSELFSEDDDNKYDYILSSETIYNPNNYEALHSIIKSHLKSTGTAYIAAKMCYFGLGGSSDLFKNYVSSKGYFEIAINETFNDGVKREIFNLTVGR